MLFVDIHTHKRKSQNALEIVHFDLNDYSKEIADICSVGVHPWKIRKDIYETYYEILYSVANSKNVVFIGETGLDSLCETPLKIQEEVFRTHIRVSEELRKPLIIHCVRCHNEIIRIKKELNPEMPWIVHGFNNRMEIASQLIQHSIYVSFGVALFSDTSNAFRVLKDLPEGTFFLETDDTDVNIEKVYERASDILSIDRNILCAIQQRNLEKILEKSNYKLCIQGQNFSLEQKG